MRYSVDKLYAIRLRDPLECLVSFMARVVSTPWSGVARYHREGRIQRVEHVDVFGR